MAADQIFFNRQLTVESYKTDSSLSQRAELTLSYFVNENIQYKRYVHFHSLKPRHFSSLPWYYSLWKSSVSYVLPKITFQKTGGKFSPFKKRTDRWPFHLRRALAPSLHARHYPIMTAREPGRPDGRAKIWEQQITQEIMWDGAYFSSSPLLANLQR
jgi:hypothetical protein